VNPPGPSLGESAASRFAHPRATQSPIKHVVIIVQENRSVDNLFQFLHGANTQSYGLNSAGQRVKLQPFPLHVKWDISHLHQYWLLDYNNGQMNGFDQEACDNGQCPVDASYSYVPEKDVAPYYSLAEAYTFADEMFETDQGPSFPAHQYLVSGTSTVSDGSANKAAGNAGTPSKKGTGGCDSPAGSLVAVITPQGDQPKSLETYPCFRRQALMDEMDAAGVSWKYYQESPGAGLWHAVDAIYSIWSHPGEMGTNVITPSSQVLTDVAQGSLASVVWVTPSAAASDHPASNNGSGPSWVASIVNALGQSQYWDNTAIFITWDDWGGFYDHVAPTIYNSFELGFRVPLIVVSPYAKAGYVSHTPHEFGSILKFTEETFGLPSLGTTDQRADDFSDCFDFSQGPRQFKKIRAQYTAEYFLRASSAGIVDDE
jgi:phospholipase C